MIFSQNLIYSDKQAITADAASTNIIDHGANGTVYGASVALPRDQGKGAKVPILVQVTETFDALTSLEVQFQVDNDVAFGSPKIVARQSKTLAELKAGAQFSIDSLPLGADERYSRLYYDVTGTAPTVGKITAGITMGNQQAPL